MTNKTKTIIGGSIIGAVAMGAVFFPSPIPADLQLKADKSKIIESKEVDWREMQTDGSFTNLGKMISYRYISSETIPQTMLGSLSEDMSKRTGNSQFFLKEKTAKEEKWVGRFYSGTIFYYIPHLNNWYRVKAATTTITAFNKQTTSFWDGLLGREALAVTTTTDTGPGDGTVAADAYNLDWDITHNAADGNTALPAGNTGYVFVSKTATGLFDIYRLFLPFYTAGISAGAAITSSSVSVYATTINWDYDDSYDYINLMATTTQPDQDTFTTAEYDLVGQVHGTAVGSTPIPQLADMETNSWVNFKLNAAGIRGIKMSGDNSTCGASLTGWSCLGLRMGNDIDDVAFAGASGQRNGIFLHTVENTNAPYLTVEYTVAISEITKSIPIKGGRLQLKGGTFEIK